MKMYMRWRQRYRIFFFGKSLTPVIHSFSENFIFFHPLFGRKKMYFVFPRKGLEATHSAEWQLPLRNRYLCTFTVFFSAKFCNIFSQAKFTTHSLTRSQGQEKEKKQLRKNKKNTFYTHSYDYSQKMSFLIVSGEKNTVPSVEGQIKISMGWWGGYWVLKIDLAIDSGVSHCIYNRFHTQFLV